MKKSQLILFVALFLAICVIIWAIQFFIENDSAFATGLAMGVVSMLGPTSFLSIRDRLIAFVGFVAVISLTYVLYLFFPARYPMPIANVLAVLIVFPLLFIRISHFQTDSEET